MEKQKEFKELTDKIIKFLNDNYHPHCKIIITTDSAELVEGIVCNFNNSFIKGQTMKVLKSRDLPLDMQTLKEARRVWIENIDEAIKMN